MPGYNDDEPFEYAGGSAYFSFTISVPEDALATFYTGRSHGNGVTAWARDTSEFTSHAASAGAAWGYMTGTEEGLSEGDVNGDGNIDEGDLDVILSNIGRFNISPDGGGGGTISGPAIGFNGDLNHDGIVDGADLQAWLPHAPANIFVVTNEVDEDDNIHSFNNLSLREALDLSDATLGSDIIRFAPWVEEIELSLGQLEIDTGNDVHIKGSGADKLTIDADGSSRVFVVDAGVTATISGMTITGGYATDGGGIHNSGDLTLDSVVLTDNTAYWSGGGVYVNNGKLTVHSSTLDDNHAVGHATPQGGAISGRFAAGTSLVIEDSTISNNTGGHYGGGISIKPYSGAASVANITNTTISGNTAAYGAGITIDEATPTVNLLNSTITLNNATGAHGGGIHKGHGAATVRADNTIIAQNTSYVTTHHDVAGSLASGSSHNIIGQVGGSGLAHNPSVTGNKVGTSTVIIDAKLAPLGDYGGKTKTHALLIQSPAIDAGKDSLIATNADQRGYQRPFNLPTADGVGGSSDIGAYEAGDATPLIVRFDEDRNDSITTSATVSSLSLREALALSYALAGAEVITFDVAAYENGPLTLTYDGTDPGSVPDRLSIGSKVTITGPGADLLIINGGGVTGVLSVGADATIENLTITGGSAAQGGGIFTSEADLTLRRVRVVGNTATSAGGGIFSENSTSLRIENSEVSGNVVTGSGGLGGGIADVRDLNKGATGLLVLNSKVSENSVTGANGFGGGIYVDQYDNTSGAEPKIISSTIAFNEAAYGGGLYSSHGTDSEFIEVHNTIIADNFDSLGANDVEGTDLDGDSSHNLIGLGGAGGLADGVDGNIVLTGMEVSGLMPLAFNGGPTQTHALEWTSDAIDAGDDAIATLYGLTTDQRGIARRVEYLDDGGLDLDIGALELAYEETYP